MTIDERALPDNYRPALAEDVPEGRACGNCHFYNEYMQNDEGTKAWCERWQDFVDGGYYCNAWQPHEDDSSGSYNDDEEERAPAPPKDQIQGSDTNKPGSAKGAGGDIELTDAIKTALQNKVTEHNDAMKKADRPSWTRTTNGQLAAVYRRGAGAFSTSHRPGVTRGQWAMARVNAFLYLLRRGNPQNAAYITDNDLLPADHPKSTRSLETRAVDLGAPEYMVDAAKRGLRLYADGEAGAGLVDATVRDARAMAQGTISEAKWRKIGPWIARHIDDLDAVDAETPITPGLVAHLLWGSGPSKSDALRAQQYAEGVVERLNSEQDRSMNKTFHISRREEIENMRENNEQTTEVETRRVTVQEFELRAGEAGSMSFRGYAAVYNSPSEPLPFTETIAPGAFDKTLRARNNVKMYLNHDSTLVLASTRAKTMKLSSDSKGLLVESDLPDTSYARDLAVLMERGDVDSMSFGFSVPSCGDRWGADGMTRELKQIRLHEVSVVTGFPAYSATSAALRSLDMLADATGLDANKLAEALTMLENGKTLSTDHADLLAETVNKLRAEPQPTEVAGSLALKRKQIDLLLNRI